MTIPTFFFQIGPNRYLDTYDVIAPAYESNQSKHVYDDPIPRTVSYAYGAPMESIDYEPMIRFMHTFAQEWHVLICGHMELQEGSSVGFINATPKPFVLPPSVVSGEFLKNAQNPIINAQLHKYFSNESAIITGFQFRRIRPRLVTDLNYETHEDVQSWSAYAGVKLKWDPVTTVLKCMYTQNGFADGNLGTYGIRTINPVTHEFTYTPLQALNVWLDCRPSQDHRYAPGIFAGFYKNLGATHPLVNIAELPPEWGFTSYKDVIVKGNLLENNQDLDIDWMIKVVPRLYISFKRFQIGAELEYHYVRFGNTIQRDALVTDTYPVNHLRFLSGFYYYF